MTPGDAYRAKAAELHEKAKKEINPAARAELEGMALGYLRLARQAERNALTDIVYDPPPSRPDIHAQQQQQIQPKKEDE